MVDRLWLKGGGGGDGGGDGRTTTIIDEGDGSTRLVPLSYCLVSRLRFNEPNNQIRRDLFASR